MKVVHFFSVEQTLSTVKSELLNVGKKGRSVTYLRDGEEKTIDISRTRTRIEIGGEVGAREELKVGMYCEIGWIGLDIGAAVIKCE